MKTTLLLACLLAPAPDADAYPRFVGLGFRDGRDDSTAHAISADGSTAVGESGGLAFYWTEAEGFVEIPKLPQYTRASAMAVSGDGSVIVGDTEIEAFRWESATGTVAIGGLTPDFENSTAVGISDDGTVIVGQSQYPVDGGPQSNIEAYRQVEGEAMAGLGSLADPHQTSQAYAVSGDGAVVVGPAFTQGGLGLVAFRWTAAGGMESLGDLPGGSDVGIANATNTSGDVVVGSGRTARGPEAFRWTASDGMVGLGQHEDDPFDRVPRFTQSNARAVSGDGSVVVGSGSYVEILGEGTTYRAFLWDEEGGGMRLLEDVLVEEVGFDLTGWTLTSANGISADGTIIVGVGTNPSGETEAWLAELPVPVEIELVEVGDSGNAADTTGYGAVAYAFAIGKLEVTNRAYAEFLNAVDPDGENLLNLYESDMGDPQFMGGIGFDSLADRGGKYAPLEGVESHPVNFVSWFDAARFVNWLESGQPRDGTGTETGAYDLAVEFPVRTPGTGWALPTYDEWYKAAFHDSQSPGADGSGSPDYWLYATASDGLVCEAPPGGAVSASCGQLSEPTDVGAYASAASAYGTMDQAGNVSEWTESEGIQQAQIDRLAPGGNIWYAPAQLEAPVQFAENNSAGPDFQFGVIGFRVVYLPEPSRPALELLAIAALGLLRWRAARNGAPPREGGCAEGDRA